MSYKTTAILLAVVVLFGVGWIAYSFVGPSPSTRPPAILNESIKDALRAAEAGKEQHIVVKYAGKQVDLKRAAGQSEWVMAGNWPTRSFEVNRLIGTLVSLESRFAAEALNGKLGLDRPAVTIELQVGDQKHKLEFGQPVSEPGNSFYQPTYLRLDGKDEAIRLAPGLVNNLRHQADYYLQRWLLLPPEKQVRSDDSPARSDRFEAVKSVALAQRAGKDTGFTLTWTGSSWELSQPVKDRVDPTQLRTILEALPDIWAERFEENQKIDLTEFGLKEPEQTVRVILGDGRTVTILVGKQSRVNRRVVVEQAPPGGPPQPPRPRVIEEPFRYAKLEALNQIFEIKAEKLNALLIPATSLRDARLARFRPEDARRLEIDWKGKKIVLAKENGVWHLTQPARYEADAAKVQDLLDKLSNLEARDQDVIDKGDISTYGLARPEGAITVTVEEEVKGQGAAKTKKTKVFHFALGKQDSAKARLYVKVDNWPRINAVEDSVVKLANRDALAYRGKSVLKFAAADLARLDIQRPSDPFTLEQGKDGWHLKAPVHAEVDAVKVDQLAGDLGQLEAGEFVAENPRADDLEKQYGLGASALIARMTFTDSKKEPQALLLGKQRPGKDEYYAKLNTESAVFTVKKAAHDTLARPSLEYRPQQLWFMPQEEIGELRLQRKEEYRLIKQGLNWRVAGPFEAPALAALASPMLAELASPRCERYEAHFAKDLAKFGLDKPYLRVVLIPAAKKADKDMPKKEEKGPKERVLLIGSTVKAGSKDRFGKMGDSEAIFVLGEKSVTALDRDAVDLLDPTLLSLKSADILRIHSTGKGDLLLERKRAGWWVSMSGAGGFLADREAADSLAASLSRLRAGKFVAYGPKVEVVGYGLKAPLITLSLIVQLPDKKERTHTVALGNEVPAHKGERYVRVDQGPGVAVLDAATVRLLMSGYLDLVSRSPWKLEPATVTGLQRRLGTVTLELARTGDGWEIAQPAKQPADRAIMNQLVAQLATLRVQGVAAYPAANLKAFGLDPPFAVVTLRLLGPDKKTVEHVLQIGGLHEKEDARGSGQRYARADKSNTVIILPGPLARQLTGDVLQFRDRTVAHLSAADRVRLERGTRKVVFAHKDGAWKMTEPVEAEAEEIDLEAFLKSLGNVRADQFIPDKPLDLKTYGLERPQATWRFYSGDKEILGLLVGGHEKIKKDGKEVDGPRCYAKLVAGDLVFLIDPQMTAGALAEYRSRALWPLSPDASQITQVRFGYRQNPFVLNLMDTTWQAVGKPEVKVDADKVRDTLATLSRARAVRYVEDRGANLKLYGLEPASPELALEVQLPTGKKVLHIGHPEGGSRRYYARVPDRADAPVFLLSEEDARGLVRTLKDLAPK